MKRHRCNLISQPIHRLAVCAFILLASAVSVALADADREGGMATACTGTPVLVSACKEEDRRLLCGAAEQAVRFFRQFGLSRQQQLEVNLCRDPIGYGSGSAIGRYDRTSGEVELLSFDAYKRKVVKNPPFGSPASRELYQSFGVHEIAHAIADKNFRVLPVPWLAQEYIAAVAQFATMESGLRSRILKRYHLKAFKTTESMSSIYYQLDPSAFAVKAYLHFLTLDDPGGFLHDLLSGAIQLGDDEDWLACWW